MQNIAEFRIIGRVGKITEHDKVTKLNVAANYNRQENGEWVTDTHWNEVTLFGKLTERAAKALHAGTIAIDVAHIDGAWVAWDALPLADFRKATQLGDVSVADAIAVIDPAAPDAGDTPPSR